MTYLADWHAERVQEGGGVKRRTPSGRVREASELWGERDTEWRGRVESKLLDIYIVFDPVPLYRPPDLEPCVYES